MSTTDGGSRATTVRFDRGRGGFSGMTLRFPSLLTLDRAPDVESI